MSGGVLEPGSCQASTAIILTCSCVYVMHFLVSLAGLNTADSTAFIITHALSMTTAYKKQNILDTVLMLHMRALIYSIMRYLVSMPHLLEYNSGSLSCMLVANPINFSSGERSFSSKFSLLLFLLFFLRSVMSTMYLIDTPSAFVMCISDTAGRIPAANSVTMSTTTFVFLHGVR